MKYFVVTVVIILAIATVIYLIFLKKSPQTTSANPSPTVQSVAQEKVEDIALKNALNLYASAKQTGADFTNGPCLGIVAPDWVLDIAHNPRQTIDDLAENQCEQFKSGQTKHFIELDPDGKLIQIH